MRSMSESGRIACAIGALVCYLAFVGVAVPHESRAVPAASVGAVTPQPVATQAPTPVFALRRDVFEAGLPLVGEPGSVIGPGEGTLPPPLGGAFVPGLRTHGCDIIVEGTFSARNAQGVDVAYAHVRENGGPSETVTVDPPSMLCDDIVTGISFDGITVGDRKYPTLRPSAGANAAGDAAGGDDGTGPPARAASGAPDVGLPVGSGPVPTPASSQAPAQPGTGYIVIPYTTPSPEATL